MKSKVVIEADKVFKAFGERPVIKDFSLRIRRGDRIGLDRRLLAMVSAYLGVLPVITEADFFCSFPSQERQEMNPPLPRHLSVWDWMWSMPSAPGWMKPPTASW